jgi:hypothetical protein
LRSPPRSLLANSSDVRHSKTQLCRVTGASIHLPCYPFSTPPAMRRWSLQIGHLHPPFMPLSIQCFPIFSIVFPPTLHFSLSACVCVRLVSRPHPPHCPPSYVTCHLALNRRVDSLYVVDTTPFSSRVASRGRSTHPTRQSPPVEVPAAVAIFLITIIIFRSPLSPSVSFAFRSSTPPRTRQQFCTYLSPH